MNGIINVANKRDKLMYGKMRKCESGLIMKYKLETIRKYKMNAWPETKNE